MTIATRLRAIVVVYLVVLGVVLGVHATTMQRAVAGGRAVAALAESARLTALRTEGITEIESALRKYPVTRDRGYLDRLDALARSFGASVAQMDVRITAHELQELETLRARWTNAYGMLTTVGDSAVTSQHTRTAVAQSLLALLAVREANASFARVIEADMANEVGTVRAIAQSSQRLSWIVGVGAAALGLLLAALLIRSITRPLNALARGTREIAKGHFGFRLTAEGRDELTEVTTDFNRMAVRLDELDRLKRDFISNVSHDLKTPLSSMQETTEALLDGLAGPLSDKQRQLLAMNVESGRRLSSMLTKLLDLSRLEARAPRNLGVLDLGQLVARAVDHLNGVRRARNAPPLATLRLPENPVLVRGDAEDIAQLLDNLLENAAKFSPTEGTIQVAIHGDTMNPGRIRLTVADEGPGIADVDKERVFERFQQTAEGRGIRSRGVGLGLAICRHIVVSHGGSIHVRDNVPRGSVFLVSLPAMFAVDEPVERELSEALA